MPAGTYAARAANHFLKWAFVEAANVIVTRQKAWADKHAVRLYQRLKTHKGHGKAATAVARHLAESSWWILTKKQGYREPSAGNHVFVQERVSAESV